jgi:hypothetical protein
MEHISKHLSESRYKKVLDAKKKEKRELRVVIAFGVLAVGYFAVHYIVYLMK